MKRISTVFLVSAALVTALFPMTTAQAAPERVDGFYCESPLPAGTWMGYFDGLREDPIISNGDDSYQPVTRRLCFASKADCVAWKYWMQTDYPTGVRSTWCKRK